jgi:hypothetical protein
MKAQTFQQQLLTAKQDKYMRFFEAIQAGDYTLSIQASEGHYCTPRVTVCPGDYSSMEMAIWRTESKGFLDFPKSSTMRGFSHYKELMECSDGSHPTVFGYVPVWIIQKLINYLRAYAMGAKTK